MEGYLVISLIVCALLAVCESMTQYGHISGFDNLIPSGHITLLAESVVRTEMDCGRRCKRYNGVCVSYFFINSIPPVCQLQSVVWNNTMELVYKEGAQYYTEQGVYFPFSCPTPSVYTSVSLSDGTVFTYSIHIMALSHIKAHAHCKSEGARLAQVTTRAKLDMIYTIRSQCPAVSGMAWIDGNNIGATDYSDPNQWVASSNNASDFADITLWKTTTNEPLDPSFWYWDQPNSLASDHCLYSYSLTYGPNTFADANCGITYFNILCEKP